MKCKALAPCLLGAALGVCLPWVPLSAGGNPSRPAAVRGLSSVPTRLALPAPVQWTFPWMPSPGVSLPQWLQFAFEVLGSGKGSEQLLEAGGLEGSGSLLRAREVANAHAVFEGGKQKKNLDGMHIAVLPSYYYGGANGVTSYTKQWAEGLLSRNAMTLSMIYATKEPGKKKEVQSMGRGSIHLIPVPYRKENKSSKNAGDLAQALEDLIRQKSPHLILSMSPFVPFVRLVGEIARQYQIPSLLLFHVEPPNLDVPETSKVYGGIDRLAAVSNYLARRVSHRAVTLGPVMDFSFWNPAAFDAPGERQTLRRRHGLEKRFVLLAPHRISPNKGQWDAVKAVRLLNQEHKGRSPYYSLVLIGPGKEYKEYLEGKIRGEELQDQVLLLPSQSRDSLRNWYAASDAVLFPTRAEALGLVSIEAQAMGKPVVAYDVGGVGETLRHQETGLLVPPGDVLSFSRAIARLGSSTGLYRRMARQARAFVLQQFDPLRILETHEEFLAGEPGIPKAFDPKSILSWLDRSPRFHYWEQIRGQPKMRRELERRLENLAFLPRYAQEKLRALKESGELDSDRIIAIYVWGSFPWGSGAISPGDLDTLVITAGDRLTVARHFEDVPRQLQDQGRAPGNIYLKVIPEKLLRAYSERPDEHLEKFLPYQKHTQGVWIAGERDVLGSMVPDMGVRMISARSLYDGGEFPVDHKYSAKAHFANLLKGSGSHEGEVVWMRLLESNLMLRQLLEDLRVKNPKAFLKAICNCFPGFFMGKPLNPALEAIRRTSLATAENLHYTDFVLQKSQGNGSSAAPAGWLATLKEKDSLIASIVNGVGRRRGIEVSALKKKLLLHLPRFSLEELGVPGALGEETDRVASSMEQLSSQFKAWHRFPQLEDLQSIRLKFRLASDEIAQIVYEKFHYIGSSRPGLHFGLFVEEKGYNPEVPMSLVTLSPNDIRHLKELIPFGYDAAASLVLSRMFAFDWAPRNSASFILGRINEWLQKELPEIVTLFTYVNPNVGFSGASYLASNWLPWSAQGASYRYVNGEYRTARQLWGNRESGKLPRQELGDLQIFAYTLHPKSPIPFWVSPHSILPVP